MGSPMSGMGGMGGGMGGGMMGGGSPMGGGQSGGGGGNDLMSMLNPMTSPMAPHNMMGQMFGGGGKQGGGTAGAAQSSGPELSNSQMYDQSFAQGAQQGQNQEAGQFADIAKYLKGLKR